MPLLIYFFTVYFLATSSQVSHSQGILSTVAPGTVIGRPIMTSTPQRIQIVPTDSGVTVAQRIQVEFLLLKCGELT